MAILSCHVSIKLPPKISDGQIISQIRDPLDVLGLRLCRLYWVKYQSPQEYPYE